MVIEPAVIPFIEGGKTFACVQLSNLGTHTTAFLNSRNDFKAILRLWGSHSFEVFNSLLCQLPTYTSYLGR
ncbi:hypothetical protein L6452_32525 [Arctium lappa]|uniref:Uncharacterized protein n=1 Tax=Arctium lappa TaxID=4217 RepID=A0ACB8Z5R2_ARCLA|nr:hypothetical protein L6452_32525 [Arctium lappa]